MESDLIEKKQSFNFIINKIYRIAKSATSRNDKLKNICSTLKNSISYYDWVGFYIADNKKNELNLGPYAGEPTEHSNITFGKGICGQVAVKKETFVVQDVASETNYLSCSPNVKSEIVVPILKSDKLIGELDIDSHTPSPFTDKDRDFVEKVSTIVSQLL